MGLNIVDHADHFTVGSAVPGAFQGRHRRRHRGIGVRAGRSHHMVGKRGVIAAAVVRVKHQSHVQRPRLQLRIVPVLPQHQQKILRRRQIRARRVNKQALPLYIAVGLIGVNRQHGHIGDQL